MKNCDSCTNSIICKHIGEFMKATEKVERLISEMKNSLEYPHSPINIEARCCLYNESRIGMRY